MRSYGQYCALAKALDVVGDRWTLLIVRELLIRKAARYTDLQGGLPGIATNLLSERLQGLIEAGVVTREEAPPPVATKLYRLTPRGVGLDAVLSALGAWGQPMLGERQPGEAFHAHWLALPIERELTDGRPGAAPVSIELRMGERPLHIRTEDGAVRVAVGPADGPDAILDGRPELVMGLLLGHLSIDGARRRGLSIRGDLEAIARLHPISHRSERGSLRRGPGGSA